MSGAVRRLALDVAPWIWVYILFMTGLAALLDTVWLLKPLGWTPPLMAGFFLNFSAVASMHKVAFWRTLPVSQRQIDLARWLQGVAGPFAGVALTMAALSLILAAIGVLRAKGTEIAWMAGAQAGCGTILFSAQITLPLLKKRIGSWSALLYAAVIIGVVFAPQMMRLHPATLPVLPALAVIGLGAAGLLFVTAGHWPLPIIGWTALLSGRHTMPTVSRPGQTGWPSLLLAQMPTILLLWGLIPVLPLLMRLYLGRDGDLSFMTLMGALVCGLVPAVAFALVMRGLRTLPLSGLSLTLHIMASLVGIQLVGSLIFAGTLTLLQPADPVPLDFALLPLAFPMLLFVLALRFGQRVAQVGMGVAVSLVSMGSIFLRYLEVTPAETLLAVALLLGLGFVLAYVQIISGRHAYRAQPLTPLSWRGR